MKTLGIFELHELFETVSLCNLAWPVTQKLEQVGLKPTETQALVVELKVCATMPSLHKLIILGLLNILDTSI